MPVGSTPYSAGSTTATRRTTADTAARRVDRRSCLEDGSSACEGVSLLYMLKIPWVFKTQNSR